VTIGILLVVLLTSTAVAYGLSRPNRWLYLLDQPNERSLHQRAVPRTGGIAVLVGLLVGSTGLVMIGQGRHYLWLLAGLPVILVSFLDDRQGLGVVPRLLAQGISAGLLLALLAGPGLWRWPLIGDVPVGVAAPLLGIGIVWMINLYNFMDGMDGFAGGMAVIGFFTLAALGGFAGVPAFTVANLLVATASAGFLVWNFPPARLFLGDVGSSLLGFLVAGMMLWSHRDAIVPIGLCLLVFSPFIVDASITLLKRLARGERIWQAHREHYYQRLVRLGWGHRRTVLVEYGLMIACGLSAVATAPDSVGWQWTVLFAWAVIYTLLANAVGRLEQGRTQ